jgi:hypothetical protein
VAARSPDYFQVTVKSAPWSVSVLGTAPLPVL